MVKFRDCLRFINAVLFFILYIPHLLCYFFCGDKEIIKSDLLVIGNSIKIKLPFVLQLLYQLHNNRYYRNVFYHRIGPILSILIGWYRPGDRYFTISKTTKIGRGFWMAHPYSTLIAAESIGDYFRCIQCITIGRTSEERPIIGNNVAVMANVVIAGNVHVGDNVTIGAGSIVTRDIPSNCFAAGVPAKVIKYKSVINS